MSGLAWDPPEVHRRLAELTVLRARFRCRRLLSRLRSPRRLLATTLAILCFLLYLLSGVFIFASREAADLDRLRLWLSGGMVIYAVYHAVRCAWSPSIPDLELTRAEQIWLGGAPVRRSSLAIYHLGNALSASLAKTLLIAVLLARDVDYWPLLVLGMFVSLVLLEVVRLLIQRGVAGLGVRGERIAKAATAALALALATQVIARVVTTTPLGSPTYQYVLAVFRSLGATAASDAVGWLALPWLPAASLVVTDQLGWRALVQAITSIGLIPAAVTLLVAVDRRASHRQLELERERLRRGEFTRPAKPEHRRRMAHGEARFASRLMDWLPADCRDAAALVARQWVSVRRYAGTIVLSFSIPALLALFPLLTGPGSQRWFYVVAAVALYTVLLAPPALKIDFRRDLKRATLLGSLPIRSVSMVVGMLLLPVLITVAFQLMTVAIAAWVTRPDASQLILWPGMLSALAVVIFAIENSLFLAYPHHERSEGIAMMVRAKLTFLGKGIMVTLALVLLVAWSVVCGRFVPVPLVTSVFVGGAVLATWIVAAAGVAATAWCWRRFSLTDDIPPE